MANSCHKGTLHADLPGMQICTCPQTDGPAIHLVHSLNIKTYEVSDSPVKSIYYMGFITQNVHPI